MERKKLYLEKAGLKNYVVKHAAFTNDLITKVDTTMP
jgi:hypothetical protein